jgi:hypothetical protein
MKSFLLTMTLILLAAVPSWAQKGLLIDNLFNGSMVPQAKLTTTIVSGSKLKPYRLDTFRSMRFQASESEIAQISQWLKEDAKKASDADIEYEDGNVTYALLRFTDPSSRNKYVGCQQKVVDGRKVLTVVFMSGKASPEDLVVIFKKR